MAGARTHNEAETAWFLAQARHRNLGQIFMDHIPTGRLDLITTEHNTHRFIVNGFRYNSSQFGNFLAGYSGAYNYGVGGYWTASAAGVILDVLEEGMYTDLDKKSIPFVQDGGAVGEMHRRNGCQ